MPFPLMPVVLYIISWDGIKDHVITHPTAQPSEMYNLHSMTSTVIPSNPSIYPPMGAADTLYIMFTSLIPIPASPIIQLTYPTSSIVSLSQQLTGALIETMHCFTVCLHSPNGRHAVRAVEGDCESHQAGIV